MLHFNSPFIIKLHYVFQDEQSLYFVMDYASGGDFGSLLNSCGCVVEGWARIWFAEMLSAVLLLHGDNAAKYIDVPKEDEFKKYVARCRNSSVE